MQRPDIEERIVDEKSMGSWGSQEVIAICEYAIYLERRIHDMQLGCEVDETRLPQSPAENPV